MEKFAVKKIFIFYIIMVMVCGGLVGHNFIVYEFVSGDVGGPPENGTTTTIWYIDDHVFRNTERINTSDIQINSSASMDWTDITAEVKGNITVDWTGYFNLSNCIVTLNGDLIINGSVIFQNVTLRMNCTIDGQYVIEVQGAGDFNILDRSIIGNGTTHNHYKFDYLEGSHGLIQHSTIEECGDTAAPDFWGLKIGSDNVVIDHNLIQNNTRGIICYHSSPVITNNIITNHRMGIELVDSSSIVQNNTISKFYNHGITNEQHPGTPARIINNTIIETTSTWGNGIYASFSDGLIIEDNRISNIGSGIRFFHVPSTSYIYNNSIENCSNGLSVTSSTALVNNTKISNCSTGVFLYSSTTSLYNSTVVNSTSYDYFLGEHISSGPSHLTLINSTYNGANVEFEESGSTIYVNWYLHVRVISASLIPISGAMVSVSDNENGSFEGSYFSDSDGYVKWILCKELIQKSGGITYYTPFDLVAKNDTLFGFNQTIINKSKEIIIILNNNSPLMKNIAPENNSFQDNNSYITIIEFIYDPIGVDNSSISIWYRINSGIWYNATFGKDGNDPFNFTHTSGWLIIADDYSIDFNVTGLINNDIVEWFWVANQTQGNQSIDPKNAPLQSYKFTIDSIIPSIILNSPGNNSIIQPGVILDFLVIDANLNEVNYSKNGGININLPDPFDISTIGWPDGDYTILINAVDHAGNFNSKWFFFTIDSNPPQIILNTPGNNSIIQSGTTLDFSIIDPLLSQTSYSVDSGPELSFSEPFDISTNGWAEGGHIVQINAEDSLGNSNSSWFYITIDDIKPTIELNSPLNNSITHIGTLLDFFISDTNLMEVNYSINGSSNLTLLDPFDISTSGWAEGNYTIQINAVDLAGNFNSSWYFITLQGSLGDSPFLSEPNVTPDKGSINDIFNYSVMYTSSESGPDIINLSIDGINYTMTDYIPYLLPNGSDFHINAYIFNEQQDPAITVYPDGTFVVVWASWQGMGLWGIYGQRYYSNGTKLGGEFEVEDVASEWDQHPDIAINPATNDFVVVWDTTDPFPYQNIYMKIFDSDGTPKTSPIMVNTHTDSYQDEPAVACSSNGNIIVAWNSWEQDGSYYGVYGQRFDSNGNPLGSEFRVNTITDDWQAFPDVVCLSNNNFIIVWMSYGSRGIYGQKYYSSGTPWGSEFKISSSEGLYEQNPSIARDASNNFIVVWKSTARSSGEEGIYFQRYSSAGSMVGSETMLRSAPDSEWAETDVVCTSNDDYLVTWDAYNQETGDWDVYVQKLGSNGLAIGEAFRAPENNTNDQKHIKIGIDSTDRFMVVWQSFDMADDNDLGIYGRRFLNISAKRFYFTTSLSHGVHTYQFFAEDDSDVINTSLLIGPHVDYPPSLTNPGITPSVGNSSTIFNYTIIYTDLDNDPPTFMKIKIDGIEYTMLEVDTTDTDYTDGKEFYFTKILSAGSHNYKFFTSDGTTEINTSLFSGPLVDNVRPITSLDIGSPNWGVDPVYVNIGTQFTLTHNNDGGGAGVAFTWYTRDDEYFEGTSFNLTGYLDGIHNITWGSMDNVGNNETGNSINVSLDTAQPTIIFDIGEPKYKFSNSWSVTPFTLFDINSTDLNSGLNFTWYTIDGVYYEGGNFTLVGYVDGLHEIGYGAEDNVGNNKTEPVITIYLDSNPPITDLIPGTPKSRGNTDDIWNVSNITEFTLSYFDQYSGVRLTWYTIDGEYYEGTNFTFSGFNEGLHTITWGSIDYLGNNESGNLKIFNLDTSPPITDILIGSPKFRLQETDNWNVTNSTEFSIGHNNDGIGSGINFTWVIIDGHYNNYSSPFTLASGYHTIIWGGVDNLNLNTSGGSIEVFVDDILPITNLTISPPKYRDTVDDRWNVTDTTTFVLVASDQHSGLNITWYTVDGNYYEGLGFTLNGYKCGLHTITWGSWDNLGNNETLNNIQVNLDNSPPTTNLSIDNPKYRSSANNYWNITSSTCFSLKPSDLGSRVNSTWYTVNGKYFEDSTFYLKDYADGLYTIMWGSKDNLLNNETDKSINVMLDNTPPITNLTIGSPSFRNNNNDHWNVTGTTVFSFTSKDNYSGINITRYFIDDKYFEGSVFNLAGFDDGLHMITWEGIDNLGNTEMSQMVIVNLDNTPPLITIDFSTPNYDIDNVMYITSSTSITLESSDTGVGITTIHYSLDGGFTYHLYEEPFTVSSTITSIIYYGEDILGNLVSETIIQIIVDYDDGDGDGIPDLIDNDYDNDGYLNDNDVFPWDPTEWLDTDHDGEGNNADTDDDNDGLLDSEEIAKGTNPLDFDSDDDGYNDDEDAYPLNPDLWKKEKGPSAWTTNWILFLVIGIIIACIIILLLELRRRGNISKEEPVIERPGTIDEAVFQRTIITEEMSMAESESRQPPPPPPPPESEEQIPPPPPPPPIEEEGLPLPSPKEKVEEPPPPPPPPKTTEKLPPNSD